ncbi:MAG: hypothetical protein KDI47_10140 [Gammaproteobacteria bacterium]|nr:hypothetical protein [Gammaproteobacteria bacterium]MCB1862076.1 hypothetical protein [Gammaproteobacteria bacterium]MCB1873173.1 hypothetical protein [Gammaproteobacteria bacterium]MCB1879636.1 hypothetical protein [Gammaproteobacteria bacterium]
MRRALALVLLLPLIALTGCAESDAPEQQIREMIERAESAVEARALLDAGALVSETYQDDEKRNKNVLIGLLGGYFLRNRSIHLLVQIARIELPDPQRASVTLYAAMAGKPIAGVDALLALRAGLYRFDLELTRETDEWRVSNSRWQPATREDFLGEPR